MPQVKNSVPQDCPTPLHLSIISSRSLAYFCPVWLQNRSSRDPLFRLDYFTRAAHRTQGNTYFCLPYMKGYDKGCRWTAIWRRTQREGWECLRVGSSVPIGLGVHYPPSVDLFTNLEVLWTHTTGISMEASLHESVSEVSRVWLFVTPWTVPSRLFHPWDFPGKNTGVGCHFLLQGIFPTQRSNPGLLHCKQTLHRLSHKGSSSLHRHEQLTPFSASLPSLEK